MRFYDELAEWWPLFSPPEEYVEEATDLLARIGPLARSTGATLLELGSGGGSLASHLKSRFALTLTDRSPHAGGEPGGESGVRARARRHARSPARADV